MATRTSREERLAQIKKEMARKQRSRNILIGVVALVVVAALVGLGFFLQSRKSDSSTASASAPANLSGDYFVTIGKSSAPTTLKFYEDFQCPVCRDFNGAIDAGLQQGIDSGKVKLELHMMSFLDNPQVPTDFSSRALNAALTVLSTSGVDTFWNYYKILYENQPAESSPGLDDAKLIDLAVQAGADKSKIESKVNSDYYHPWIVKATQAAFADGVNSTPSVYVNGAYAGANLGNSITAVQQALAK